jgi:hypothetical protein
MMSANEGTLFEESVVVDGLKVTMTALEKFKLSVKVVRHNKIYINLQAVDSDADHDGVAGNVTIFFLIF